jgi:GNAT superfamily N-acetyltransferase
MFAEVAIPLLAALFLEINALIIALMIVAFLAHEATALWDVSYAVTRREVTPFEQHVHSFLEMLPLMAAAFVATLHWPQFLALFGAGTGAGPLRPDREAGAVAGSLYRRGADRSAPVRTAALSRGAAARFANSPRTLDPVPAWDRESRPWIGLTMSGRGSLLGTQHERLVVAIEDDPDPAAKQAAGDALYGHNIRQTGVADRRPIATTVTDPATGTIIGGLWGRTELGLLFIDMAFLPEELRGQRIGGRLLVLIEAEARRRGCRHAVVETSTFQAPDFYRRHGFTELGRVPFDLPGQARIFLHKALA